MTIDVGQRDRQPVDFEFANVGNRIDAGQLADALVERAQFVAIERIRQRQHRLGMLIRRETRGGDGADALGGRCRRAQFRKAILEFDEFAQQRIVIEVGNLRIVEDVVAVVRVVDGRAQVRDSPLRIRRGLRLPGRAAHGIVLGIVFSFDGAGACFRNPCRKEWRALGMRPEDRLLGFAELEGSVPRACDGRRPESLEFAEFTPGPGSV